MGKKNIILLVGFVVMGLILAIFFLSPNQQSSNLADNINASRDSILDLSKIGRASCRERV